MVILMEFNVKNVLLTYGGLLLQHPVYISVCVCVCVIFVIL